MLTIITTIITPARRSSPSENPNSQKAALALTPAFGVGNAHAILERVGPPDPSPTVRGYPARLSPPGFAPERLRGNIPTSGWDFPQIRTVLDQPVYFPPPEKKASSHALTRCSADSGKHSR